MKEDWTSLVYVPEPESLQTRKSSTRHHSYYYFIILIIMKLIAFIQAVW